MPKIHAGCFLFCLLVPYITKTVFNRKTIFQFGVSEYKCLCYLLYFVIICCNLPVRVLGIFHCHKQ